MTVVVVGSPHWRWRLHKLPPPDRPWSLLNDEQKQAWDVLGLRGGPRNSVLRYGLSIEQVAAMSDAELLRLRNLGRKGVAEIRSKIPYTPSADDIR